MHSTRRGRQSLSYSSTPLYKVIMIFNTLMNISASIVDSLAPETPARQAIFSYFLIAYLLVAIAVVAVRIICKLIPDESDQRKTSRTLRVDAALNFVFTDLSLFLAGVLYLGGDNILILYKSFDATVLIGDETVKARDLRSYIVAVSLAFMIIAQIGPFLARRISEYIEPLREMTLVVEFDSCESAQTNGTGFWENMRQATLYIPPGHYPKWKGGKDLVLRYEPCSANCDGEQQSLISKICLTHSDGTVDLSFFGKSKDFVHMSEIRVNIPELGSTSEANQKTSTPAPDTPTQHRGVTIYGKNPGLMFKTNKLMKYAWSAEFQIPLGDESDVDSSYYSMESQKYPFQVKYESKIASWHLTQACFSLLDYALIADALYTTMLDEITQQDDVRTGKNCPSAHLIVALILFCLIIITWVIVVVLILPIGFCSRKEYFKICFDPNEFEKIKKQIIRNISTLKCSNLKFYCQLIKVILSDISFHNDHKKCCLILSVVSVTIIVIVIMIVIIIIYTAVFLIPLFIVVTLASMLIGMILLVCYCCCCTCCQELCACAITPASVIIMTIYLPLYLIADNSWPWICWVDRAKWKFPVAAILNAIAALISIVPILYKVLTYDIVKPPNQPDEQIENQKDKQNEEYVRTHAEPATKGVKYKELKDSSLTMSLLENEK